MTPRLLTFGLVSLLGLAPACSDDDAPQESASGNASESSFGDEGNASDDTDTSMGEATESETDGDMCIGPPALAGDGDGDGGGVGDGDEGGDGDGDGDGEAGDGDGDEDPTMPGTSFQPWVAEDFQPLSCNYGKTYGLGDAFVGTVTVVINWRATCSYCQAQAAKFEQLRIELATEGYDVYFAGLNQVGYDSPEDQALLTERCSFSLFQGTEGNDLWAQQGGAKDSLYIYGIDGVLATYMSPSGELSTNMSTEEGYANVKNAILDVIGQ